MGDAVRTKLRTLVGISITLALVGLEPVATAAEYQHAMATKMLRREAYRAAARRYRDAHAERPELAGPLAGWALCQCHIGQLDEARDNLAQADPLDPHEPLLFEARACIAGRLGEFEVEAAHLRRAAEISVNPNRMGQLGSHYVRHGLFVEAMDVAEQMRESGLHGRSSSMLAVRYGLATGDEDEVAFLAEDIAILGRTHRSGMILGTLVALSQDHLVGEAVAPYDHYSPRTRAGDSVLLLRAEACRLLGQLDEAEQQAGRRKQEPDEPIGVAILARIACDLGDLDGAEGFLAIARERWPLHPSPILSEAVLRARQGRDEEAWRCLELARERGIPAWDRHVEDDLVAELARGTRSP